MDTPTMKSLNSTWTGSSLQNPYYSLNVNTMKEINKKLFKLTFLKTDISKIQFEIMAESKEEAEKFAAEGNYLYNGKLISSDVELIKNIQVGKSILE